MTTTDSCVTLRIVFDGAPNAGKTTAARSLADSLGRPVLTPSEYSGRTVWFDWIDYVGGRHDGRPIRVELVTVPGQREYADRREHLLEWGDVIVFVVDSSATQIDASVDQYQLLRSYLARIGERPVILLANQRDAPDAVDVATIRERFGISDDVEVVESVATTGVGIRQIFVYAVREGIAFQSTIEQREQTDPDELFQQVQQHHEQTKRERAQALPSIVSTNEVPSPNAKITTASTVDLVNAASTAYPDLPPPVAPAKGQHEIQRRHPNSDLALSVAAADDDCAVVLSSLEWIFLVRLINGGYSTASPDVGVEGEPLVRRLLARQVLVRTSDSVTSADETPTHAPRRLDTDQPNRSAESLEWNSEPLPERDIETEPIPVLAAQTASTEPPRRRSSFHDPIDDVSHLTDRTIATLARAADGGFVPPLSHETTGIPSPARDRAIRRIIKRLR